MNKKGFTLTEVLLTMGILGIVAAVTLPGLVSNRPCENKIKFQKAYTTLSNITADLIDDEIFYYRTAATPAASDGLQLTGAPIAVAGANNNPFNIQDNTPAWRKFAYLVADKVTRNGAPNPNSANINLNSVTFTTTDGTVWTFTNPNIAGIVARVQIDVNNEMIRNNNVLVNDTSKDNVNIRFDQLNNDQREQYNNIPDTFRFDIDRDGAVTTLAGNNGAFERYLLRHPSQLNRRVIIDDIRDINTPLDNK